MKSLDVGSCSQCWALGRNYEVSWGEFQNTGVVVEVRWCYRARKKVPDITTIPDFCPLEDKPIEKAKQGEGMRKFKVTWEDKYNGSFRQATYQGDWIEVEGGVLSIICDGYGSCQAFSAGNWARVECLGEADKS